MDSPINWSIDTLSGHCRHTSGIELCVASSKSLTLTPLIGPYTPQYFNEHEVAAALVPLIKEIELDRSHVVFGSLGSSQAAIWVESMGQEGKWIPDFSARTSWIWRCRKHLTDSELLELMAKEWTSDSTNKAITHSSGVTFFYSQRCFSTSLSNMFTKFRACAVVGNANYFEGWDDQELTSLLHGLGNIGFKVLCKLSGIKLLPRLVSIEARQSALTRYTANS